ncbi:MAG: polysaccharide pyruvyl transferase CsaB [Acidobacteriota bacterium]
MLESRREESQSDMDDQTTEQLCTTTSSRVDNQKVVIAGYYGFGNTGDEAILSAMLADLRASIPELDIVVVSGSPERTATAYAVKSVSHIAVSSIIAEIETCDLIIVGGGGLFHDYWGVKAGGFLTHFHSGITYYAIFSLLAALLEKPVLLYALGVGPLLSDTGRQFTRMSFELATTATVRDAESKELLASIGLDETRVTLTADPAFRLSRSGDERALIVLESQGLSPSSQVLIGVALREWDVGVETESWSIEIAKGLDSLIERFDARIVFLPLQRLDDALTNDIRISLSVRDQMRHGEHAILLQDEYSPGDMAALLAQCRIVIGMRLHSIILAASAHVPVIALVYDPKVKSVMRQLRCEEFALDLRNLDAVSLFQMTERALRDRASIVSRLGTSVTELAGAAEENNRLAVTLLKTGGASRANPPEEVVRFLNRNLIDLILRNDNREHAVEVLQAELSAFERAARLQSEEIESRDRIIWARDEGISWVRQELKQSQEENRRLATLNESLESRLKEISRQSIESTSRQAQLEQVSGRLAEKDAAFDNVLRDFENKQKQVDELTARLSERDQAFLYRSAQVEERESIIAARDDAIAVLKARLSEAEFVGEELNVTNQLLATQLDERSEAVLYRSAQVEERERIIASRDDAIAALQVELNEAQDTWRRMTADSQLLSSRVEQSAHTIASLEAASTQLKAELNDAEGTRQGLSARTQLLSAQLSKTEHLREMLTIRAANAEGDLDLIRNTFAWRLLSLIGLVADPSSAANKADAIGQPQTPTGEVVSNGTPQPTSDSSAVEPAITGLAADSQEFKHKIHSGAAHQTDGTQRESEP